jgi:hypothetical protein
MVYQPYVSFDQDGSKSSAKKLKQPMMEYRRNADRRQYRAMATCSRATEVPMTSYEADE